MKFRILFAFWALLLFVRINAQIKLPSDSLVADFHFFCDKLEETHPDPYTAFGGKPFFRQSVSNTAAAMARMDSLTSEDFVNMVNEFLVPLHDQHTYITNNNNSYRERRYVQRIRFNVVPEGLMLSGITDKYANLLGSMLSGINGVGINDIAMRMATKIPSENQFGNLAKVSWSNEDVILKELGVPFTDSIEYSLILPTGEIATAKLPLVDEDSLFNVSMTILPSRLKLPLENLTFQFIDEGKDVMFFRCNSVMARENYQYCLENGWKGAYEDIQQYYRWNEIDMPADTTEILKGIPSFSEEFAKMLRLMSDNGSKYLIIDLRWNSGGWTPIVNPSLMMLYGDAYFEKDFGMADISMISPLYLDKMNMTIDDLNASWGTDLEIGDYYLSDIPESDVPVEQRRMEEITEAMTATKDLLIELDGKPLYRPEHIFVLTDAGTFSAAFHYAYFLWKLGATLVGVPSAQAPNTFMEVTPFTLPYSGLKCSSSNTMQIFFPPGDKREKIMWPDMELNQKIYELYDFDANSDVLMILDKCTDK